MILNKWALRHFGGTYNEFLTLLVRSSYNIVCLRMGVSRHSAQYEEHACLNESNILVNFVNYSSL